MLLTHRRGDFFVLVCGSSRNTFLPATRTQNRIDATAALIFSELVFPGSFAPAFFNILVKNVSFRFRHHPESLGA
ncbi:MAG: hypothetical protein WBW01_05855, partial [Terriglobales bacterium]